ncbi:MAG: 4Fe-4S dicluster domain-containing protein [Trichlorobacter sp.]
MPEGRQLPLHGVRRCSGCGRCVAACPERIITLTLHNHRKQAVITDPGRCTACGACIAACPLSGPAPPDDQAPSTKT